MDHVNPDNSSSSALDSGEAEISGIPMDRRFSSDLAMDRQKYRPNDIGRSQEQPGLLATGVVALLGFTRGKSYLATWKFSARPIPA